MTMSTSVQPRASRSARDVGRKRFRSAIRFSVRALWYVSAMNAVLPYAGGTIDVTLPDDTRRLTNVGDASLPALADLDGAVRAALASPIGMPRIRELVKPNARVTIAF